jgi:hypothetical protein
MITVIQVILSFLGICLVGGIIFYIIFDLKPWKRDSQLWDPQTDIGSAFHTSKIFTQEKFFSRNTWRHIKSYYMYYGLALIIIAFFYSA